LNEAAFAVYTARVPFIEIRHLHKLFGPNAARAMALLEAGRSKTEVLAQTGCTVGVHDASFRVERSETFVIMGLSGSGKSTLLRCLNRLTEPSAGQISIDGENILALSAEGLRDLRRRRVSMVFQHFGLLPHRSVLENVAFGLEIQGIARAGRNERARRVIECVGLAPYASARVQALSGGMQQRVGLARALANDPEILLMDEAFSALDPLIRAQLQDELIALQGELRKTLVFITHDLDEALKLGDRIAIMKEGRIVQIDTPEGILTRPADDYVRAFVRNVDRTRVVTAGAVMRRDAESLRAAEPLREKDAAPIRPETPIRDLLEYAARRAAPLPVVDEHGRVQGAVTRAGLLAAIAGHTDATDTAPPRQAPAERARTGQGRPASART
jgi:glycine betaine/proline transport system ATP-binding protein